MMRPNTTPKTAICTPRRIGRVAIETGLSPIAIDVPISRLCVSTIRAAKFKAANAAHPESGRYGARSLRLLRMNEGHRRLIVAVP